MVSVLVPKCICLQPLDGLMAAQTLGYFKEELHIRFKELFYLINGLNINFNLFVFFYVFLCCVLCVGIRCVALD